MTHSEIVKNYVKANPTPDQNCCPDILIYWYGTKNGRRYTKRWRPLTGEMFINGTIDNLRGYSVKSYDYQGAYIKAISDDMLEVGKVILAGNRGIDGEKRLWKFTDRLFIFKGDKEAYNAFGDVYCPSETGRYYNKEAVRFINSCGSFRITTKHQGKELEKWTGVENNYGHFPYYWVEAYKKMMPRNQRSEIDIPDIDVNAITPLSETAVEVFQIIDEDWAVIRGFVYERAWNRFSHDKYGYERTSDNYYEKYRLLVNKDGKKVRVLKKDCGVWRQTSQSIRTITYGDYKLVNFNEIDQWNPFKWLKSCLNEENTASQIVMMLRHPIVETLIKSGYPNIAKGVMDNNQIKANLKHYFGSTTEKGSIAKVLGVNKHLLQAIEKMEYRRYISPLRHIRIIKTLLGFDVSELSKESVEKYVIGAKALEDLSGNWERNLFPETYRWYSQPAELTEDNKKVVEKLIKAEVKQAGSIRLFSDSKSMFNRLSGERRPTIELEKFDGYDELLHIHNALVELTRIEDEERRARYNELEKQRYEDRMKKFKKLQDDRIKDYEEIGTEYSVIVPKQLSEITTEGSSLHHCVGGYLDRHARGETNILFIRKTNELNIPFYTMEIRDGKVVQIHGLYNRWLGNDSDVIPFVYQYLKARDISFDKKMLLNLGQGYSPSTENLSEKYLTA